jgi:putative nucleotidyltransferase with HDIG domain
MFVHERTQRVYWAAEVLVLAGVIGAAAYISRPDEWRPLALVGLLLGLSIVGEWFTIETPRGEELSASFVALILAMSLLGPAPAVALGVAAIVFNSLRRRLSPSASLDNLTILNNLTIFAFVLFVGGLLVRGLAGDVHDPRNHEMTQGVTFGLIVFAACLLTTGLNFFLLALNARITAGRSLLADIRERLVPVLPGELATGVLATLLAIAYTNFGLPILLSAIVVLLIFQYLTIALLRSEDRADQLQARSVQLASLQFGVLAMLMDALALRDHTAGRHAAAVARYARQLAREVGCDEAEQDLVHTAGLLHDIGKFTWSDSTLHPEALTDRDMGVIHRHPQDGATLVGKLDGYGPVADAILYHHERVDGGGYPAGLIGSEIPLASRIIAICSTYDTMTATDSYRTAIPPEDAIAELRKVAGRQLDADLVESFIATLEREGPAFAEQADYDSELGFERRVRALAQPSAS